VEPSSPRKAAWRWAGLVEHDKRAPPTFRRDLLVRSDELSRRDLLVRSALRGWIIHSLSPGTTSVPLRVRRTPGMSPLHGLNGGLVDGRCQVNFSPKASLHGLNGRSRSHPGHATWRGHSRIARGTFRDWGRVMGLRATGDGSVPRHLEVFTKTEDGSVSPTIDKAGERLNIRH